ncbi:hypothetical protein [Longimicrobium sp.]|uniref:hypothetical protein n=1 Tax=Longimicrobium sp. TaxID=2029185 RepID=UPI002E36A439|nr:hypothetical protein [Longimicrobium sp.]HEX6041428.1 hypothetical protein [Longimicrobium sp.]
MTLRPFVALVGLCAAAACAPIVTHGPRAERGLQVTATAGLPQELCDTTCAVDLVPQIGFGARVGRPAEGGRMGYSVGGTFSASLFASEADVYLQAPTAPDWAAGGGVLLSPMHVMPYVQLGRMGEDGSGWYTTQGFAWLAQRTDLSLSEGSGDLVKPRYWAPTVAYRFTHRGGATHLYVSGAFGSTNPLSPARTENGPVRTVFAGIAVERQVRTPVQLGPPPAPPVPAPPSPVTP